MIKALIILLISMPHLSIHFTDQRNEMDFMSDYLSIRYPQQTFRKYVVVRIKHQKLQLIEDGQIKSVYDISSAKKGIGNMSGSEKTPVGLLKIAFKLGDEVPIGGVLKGRRFTGDTAQIYSDTTTVIEDLVLTRAIRLEGMEPGINKNGVVDTYKRHIYIHGTPEEGLIGSPASHGCIRMKNTDILKLYDHLNNGDYIVVLNL